MHRIIALLLVALIALPAFGVLDEDDRKKPSERNPLRVISKMMDIVARRLRKLDTGQETQRREGAVVEGIDKLIEIARQQQQQQKQKQKQQQKDKQKQQSKPKNTQSQAKGRKPMQDEKAVRAGTTDGKLRPDVGAAGMEWGNLPPKAREEFLQILKENFPENYKQLVRYYFKNLSEQP